MITKALLFIAPSIEVYDQKDWMLNWLTLQEFAITKYRCDLLCQTTAAALFPDDTKRNSSVYQAPNKVTLLELEKHSDFMDSLEELQTSAANLRCELVVQLHLKGAKTLYDRDGGFIVPRDEAQQDYLRSLLKF